ncbi:MAG: ribosome silencing factor [Chitinophagales bacterium]|nr:ribosome silencing factor [Chitinophagales bacterium]MDW8273287.1 ribosome silencing factor [Chitinophagales bacterium]
MIKKKTNSIASTKLRKIIVNALLDKKGKEVLTLDLRSLNDRPADFFIIAHGDSTTQVKALADNVEEKTTEQGIKPNRKEGVKNSEWIIIDFSDTLVHIFHRDKRDFYQLEELWHDAKRVQHRDKPQKN